MSAEPRAGQAAMETRRPGGHPMSGPNRAAILLGREIQKARKAACLTQADVSEALDIALRSVVYDEAGGSPDGGRPLTLKRLAAYAAHYRVAPQELLLRAGLYGTMGNPEIERFIRARMSSIRVAPDPSLAGQRRAVEEARIDIAITVPRGTL